MPVFLGLELSLLSLLTIALINETKQHNLTKQAKLTFYYLMADFNGCPTSAAPKNKLSRMRRVDHWMLDSSDLGSIQLSKVYWTPERQMPQVLHF